MQKYLIWILSFSNTGPSSRDSIIIEPIVKTNAIVNDSDDNKDTAGKLESTEKFKQNIGGDGYISKASCSTQQDKVEPKFNMNDELKKIFKHR